MAREEYPEYTQSLALRKADLILQKEKELEQDRGKYLAAKKATAGRDSEEMIALARLVKSYQAGEVPEKAVYILAQATALIAKMVLPFAIVINYETKEREVEKLRK